MKWQYMPKDRNGRLAWLQCELCEAGHEIAKINRWGAHSRHPDKGDDPVENPSNAAALLMEMWDIEYAMKELGPDLLKFLGPELIGKLRAKWESEAFPPQTGPTGSTGPALPMITCTTCNGEKMLVTETTPGRITREACPDCNGRGLRPQPQS